MSPMSLIDLDPIPVTTVAGGRGTETVETQLCNLVDVFAPEAASASPFVPPPPPGISEGSGTPRTPRVGTSSDTAHTPEGVPVARHQQLHHVLHLLALPRMCSLHPLRLVLRLYRQVVKGNGDMEGHSHRAARIQKSPAGKCTSFRHWR